MYFSFQLVKTESNVLKSTNNIATSVQSNGMFHRLNGLGKKT